MKTKLKIVSLLMLCALVLTSKKVNSQELVFEDVFSANLKDFEPILVDNEVKGYSLFYVLDKVDKKNKSYRVTFLDQNLTTMGSVDFIEPKHFYMVENTFNGNNIIIKFYDTKEEVAVIHRYSTIGELVSRDVYPVENKMEQMTLVNAIKTEEEMLRTIQPIKNKGYVSYGYSAESKYGYELKYFPDEKGQKGWSIKQDSKAKGVATAGFLCEGDGILINTIISRPSLMSMKNMTSSLQIIDVNNGKVLSETNLSKAKYPLMVTNGKINPDTKNLDLLAVYYNQGDDIFKDNSAGFAFIEMTTSGEILNEVYSGWQGEIANFLPVDKKGKVNDGYYVYVHDLIKDSEGNMFVIGEQYKKAISGLGVAANVLGGADAGVAATKVVLQDVVILKYNKNRELVDVHICDKPKRDVMMPQGATMMGPVMMGHYIKSRGLFDYTFNQVNNKMGSISVVYETYDEDKKRTAVLGILNHSEGKFSNDNTSFNMKEGDYEVFKGKPGYILLGEYIKKEKRISMRLEKINY